MKCAVCKNGELFDSLTEYQTKINGEYVVVKNVPVQECNICGEKIMLYETIKKVEEIIKSKKKHISKSEIINQALTLYIDMNENEESPYELGKEYFGKYANGDGGLSVKYKKEIKRKIHEKNAH